MYPNLFQWECNGQTIFLPTYGTAIVVAISVCSLTGWMLLRRLGVSSKVSLTLAAATTLAILLGARLAYWLFHADARNGGLASLVRWDFVDLYLPGGLLAALLIEITLSRLTHQDPWRVADGLAPGLAFGAMILRLGCFLTGCCFGLETSLPWGVTYPSGSLTHCWQIDHGPEVLFTGPRPVHPTQLYELLGAAAAAATALLLLHRRAQVGAAALAATAVFFALRCGNDCFRAEIGAFHRSPDRIFCVVAVVCCLILLAVRTRRTPRGIKTEQIQ
jgi:phosphatidylglycerol:prolipoprotein diacylglycerol transferase